jgi:hypothetical protein
VRLNGSRVCNKLYSFSDKLTESDDDLAEPFLQVSPHHSPMTITNITCHFLGEVTTPYLRIPIASKPDVILTLVRLLTSRFPRYTSSLIPPSWKFNPPYRVKSRKDDDQIFLDSGAASFTPSGIQEILSYRISQLTYPFWRIYDAKKTLNESYVNPGSEVLVRAIGKVKPGDVVY